MDLGSETIYDFDASESMRMNVVQYRSQTLFLYSSLLLIILLQAIHCCGDQLSQGRGGFPKGESALVLSDLVSTDVGIVLGGVIAVVAADVLVETGDGVVEVVKVILVMFVSSLSGW